jgi:hypothetical protein
MLTHLMEPVCAKKNLEQPRLSRGHRKRTRRLRNCTRSMPPPQRLCFGMPGGGDRAGNGLNGIGRHHAGWLAQPDDVRQNGVERSAPAPNASTVNGPSLSWSDHRRYGVGSRCRVASRCLRNRTAATMVTITRKAPIPSCRVIVKFPT